jgi:hypothetical protein
MKLMDDRNTGTSDARKGWRCEAWNEGTGWVFEGIVTIVVLENEWTVRLAQREGKDNRRWKNDIVSRNACIQVNGSNYETLVKG